MLAAGTASARRQRALVLSLLAVVAIGAWFYLALLAAVMDDMGSTLAMPMTAEWSVRDWVFMSSMWVVMMSGMMIPSAAPMMLAYSRFNAGRRSTPMFVTGYLVAWSGFAVAAAATQWMLHDLALVSPMGVAVSPVLAGGLLLAAGLYQFTPLKHACLRACRSPLGFLMTEWREGRAGALVMGARHGMLCITCCWALMVLLFVLGVMNLAWVAVLAIVVMIEKLIPWGTAFSWFAGAAMITWAAGLFLLG